MVFRVVVARAPSHYAICVALASEKCPLSEARRPGEHTRRQCLFVLQVAQDIDRDMSWRSWLQKSERPTTSRTPPADLLAMAIEFLPGVGRSVSKLEMDSRTLDMFDRAAAIYSDAVGAVSAMCAATWTGLLKPCLVVAACCSR